MRLASLAATAAFFLASTLPVRSEGVPILVLEATFACRDMGNMIRLGLHQLDGDKAGFLTLYSTLQDVGACVPLREGTIGLLQDVHDEQGLHLVCLKQAEDPACFWSVSPRFGPAP